MYVKTLGRVPAEHIKLYFVEFKILIEKMIYVYIITKADIKQKYNGIRGKCKAFTFSTKHRKNSTIPSSMIHGNLTGGYFFHC